MKNKRDSKNFLPEPERSNTTDHLFITNTHIPELAEDMKNRIKTFPRWAYIDHEPDSEDGSPHTHFYLETSGSYKLKTVARRLGIEPNYVQFVDNSRSSIRYLIHADHPDKKQYTPDDIISNCPGYLKCNFVDNSDDTIYRLFDDLDKFFLGEISRRQFVDLHFPQIQKMPFMNQVRLYTLLRFDNPDNTPHST